MDTVFNPSEVKESDCGISFKELGNPSQDTTFLNQHPAYFSSCTLDLMRVVKASPDIDAVALWMCKLVRRGDILR
eukprot:12399159-Karenia_brevis.AAC.1